MLNTRHIPGRWFANYLPPFPSNSPKKLLPFLLLLFSILLFFTLAGCASPSVEVDFEERHITLPTQQSSVLDGELIVQASMASLVEDACRQAVLADWQKVNELAKCLLTIDGLGIEEPVLCGVSDNKAWLRRAITGEYSIAGTVFLDSRCNLGTQPIKLIHGHNMKGGEMFGRLPSLLELESVEDAPIIRLTFEQGSAEYKVFSVMSVNSKQEALPLNNLANETETAEVLEDMLARSLVPGGKISSYDVVVLNTCWYGESGTERNLHCLVAASRV